MRRSYSWKNLVLVVLVMLFVSTTFNLKDHMLRVINSVPTSSVSKHDEMNARTAHMRQACSNYPHRRQLKGNLGGRLFYISEKYKLSYCRVAKVGSTFWTQVFMTLADVKPVVGGTGELNSMFEMPRDEAHGEMKKHKDLTMPFGDERIHATTSFLVARSPYSRLFSSYIDQIYLPNKWAHAAHMVTGERQQCGSDVTFDEFLSSIANQMVTKKGADLHWAPIFSICLPCEADIDLLAKQETFNEDAEYILNLVGVEKSIVDEVDHAIAGANVIDNHLGTLVHTYVTKGHNVKHGCITEFELAKKIWSAFQIQGYIHNDMSFPENSFTAIEKEDMEIVLLDKVLKASSERKLSSEERDAQRQMWKVHFWKTVSKTTLELVQDAYYEDFYVFGYDMDPNNM